MAGAARELMQGERQQVPYLTAALAGLSLLAARRGPNRRGASCTRNRFSNQELFEEVPGDRSAPVRGTTTSVSHVVRARDHAQTVVPTVVLVIGRS